VGRLPLFHSAYFALQLAHLISTDFIDDVNLRQPNPLSLHYKLLFNPCVDSLISTDSQRNLWHSRVAMKRILFGVISLTMIVMMTYGLLQWRALEKQNQDISCNEAKHALNGVEIRARALAAGMTVEAYANAEEEDVAKLIRALEGATTAAEIDEVMENHAAAIEAENASLEEEVNARGTQAFLEQRLKKQRIPVDVKLQLERAAKAVNLSCS
jgi:acylphosphatase